MNYTGQVKNTTVEGVTIQADSSLTASTDPNSRKGWLFNKVSNNSDKFNLYFWSEGNQQKTTNQLRHLSAVITIDNYQNVQSLPFFIIYTKAKGDGTDAELWYNAKRIYTINPLQDIELGQKIEMYSKTKPTYNNIRQVQFNTKSEVGVFSDFDPILYITIHSDSTSPTGTKMLIENLGLSFIDSANHNEIYLELVSP